MQKECPHCGKGKQDGNQHCIFCGKPLEVATPAEVAGEGGKAGRYVLAVVVCAAIVLIHAFVFAALGFRRGGGNLVLLLVWGFVAVVWRKITKG